ncbi:phenazine biosynthesis protein PhzF family [Leifsonia sp. Leaf336]|uniref:PhzF family phenazine biosynthesis protein n=1 Tax=Leifsonia sp. Leaf336 TaxID=1736341 RepID=UPI00070016D3|nr:PhzF family phenazine biosynthesis protein [Leifsonia sp. Leaf336]KQR51367.1 phenazine biosynthesis protein PhzF family [Leifsonia sp. Leaf336]
MDVPFFWVDVFADRPLTGNPLSLVPDADALDEATMRAIAREFNQSETTFLVEPTERRADIRLRSFTPDGVEVFGAGHNAMGAWLWLAGSGRLGAGEVFAQQIGGEVLPVRVSRDRDGRARVSMDQSAAEFTGRLSQYGPLASALSVSEDAVAGIPEVGSTGAAHLLVPLVSAEVVDAVRPDSSALKAVLADAGAEGCYVYTTAVPPGSAALAYSRFFNPTVGIAEDAATGTAAGPLAARLVRDGDAAADAPIVIEQGRYLGRPSAIMVVIDNKRVTISGTGVVTGSGTLHL